MPLRTFVVPSCESRELNFLVDFASTASPAGEHRLEIFSESDIDAAATIKLTTALTTKARRTVGRRVGQVSVSFINLTNPIRYGPDQRVARIKLSADNQDDHLVQAITFTNDGTARDNDLTDFYLETSYGQRVTSITQQMFEDQARIVFNPPYLLKRGRDRIFNLRAAANVTNRSVQFIVEEPSDIDVQRVHVRSMRRY